MTGDQLKKSILKHAIEGKLCKQDPADEPADALLARIRAEKRRLFKEGKLKKSTESRIYKDEDGKWRERVAGKSEDEEVAVPFELPAGWAWARLGEIFQHNSGKALNALNSKGTLRQYITTSNVYWGHFNLENIKTMLFTEEELARCSVKRGDLLVCEGGDVGRAAIWDYDVPMCIQNHIHRLRPYQTVCIEFYYFVFFAYKSLGLITGRGIGIKCLSSTALGKLLLPIPPLAEQKRIAERVAALFEQIAIIDEGAASLERLFADFKKRALALAVQGKLVPQNPEDEPAEELLKRIRKEKRKLFKEGKLKKSVEACIYKDEDGKWRERVAGKSEDEEVAVPFELPAGWAWARLGEAVIFNPRNSLPDGTEVSFVDMKAISEGFGSRFAEQGRLWKDVKQGFTHFQDGDVGFAKITPCFQNRKSVIFAGLRNGHGAGTTELHVLRPIKGTILPEYLLIFVKSPYLIAYGQSKFIGTAGQKRFGTSAAQSALIPIPPLAEQRRIAERIEAIFAAIDSVDGGGASTEQAGQSHDEPPLALP